MKSWIIAIAKAIAEAFLGHAGKAKDAKIDQDETPIFADENEGMLNTAGKNIADWEKEQRENATD